MKTHLIEGGSSGRRCRSKVGDLAESPGLPVTHGPNLGGFKQQECILSQLWRLEVQDQGVGRAVLPLTAPGKSPHVPLPAAGGCQQFSASSACQLPCVPPSSPGVLPLNLCVSGSQLPSSYKDTRCWIRNHPRLL